MSALQQNAIFFLNYLCIMVWSILVFLHLFPENKTGHTQIKTLKLAHRSDKSTFLCPSSAFATRCVFQHWAKAWQERLRPRLPSAPHQKGQQPPAQPPCPPTGRSVPKGPTAERASLHIPCALVWCALLFHFTEAQHRVNTLLPQC